MKPTKIQRKKKNLEIYNFDKEIDTIFNQAENTLSERNFELMQKYDQELMPH
jgi:hypothetical protein